MQDIRLYSLLALAGTTPFVACALLPLSGIEAFAPFGPLDAVASSYGLAIVTFLAGAHWGTYLSEQGTLPFNLFITSNVVFLVAWFAYVAASLSWAIGTQVIAFLFLLFVDLRLMQTNVITVHYFRVRTVATTIALISLVTILLT